jgi:tRNA-2-methylthio-N6-dimethylallyladenosine synthase
VGAVAELMIEGPSKTDPARMSGRTRQNRLVHVPATAETVPGALVQAKLTHAAAHYLLGEVVPSAAASPAA